MKHATQILTFAIGMVLMSGVHGTLAQDSTPPAVRDVPAASECKVAPVALNDVTEWFARLSSTPVIPAEPADANATPPAYVVETGTPADAATIAKAESTVRELIACTNFYGLRGLLSLSTTEHIDANLNDAIGRGVSAADAEQVLRMPVTTPTADESVAFIEIRDVQVMMDGRVGLISVADEPGIGVTENYFIFTVSGEQWLLDEDYEYSSDSSGS